MRNPIENLGDYNKVRIALQNAGGDLDVLYKQIGDAAVAKKAPGLLAVGSIVGAGLAWLCYQGHSILKRRKDAVTNEPMLKEQLNTIIQEEQTKALDNPVADIQTNTDEEIDLT